MMKKILNATGVFAYIFLYAICLSLTLTATACTQKTNYNKDKKEDGMKTLIVYFTYSHGNTKSIAERVQREIGGDIEELHPIAPYTKDYKKLEKQGEEEVKSGFKPKLKPLNVDIAKYERIIVGTPTWWYKMSPVILSFLSSHDLKGKTVVPFSTNAGWEGSVIKDMTELAEKQGAKVENAHAFLFLDGSDTPSVNSPEELDKWIDSLK